MVLFAYAILVLIVFAVVVFIARHYRKYGYLAPRFRVALTIFALIALGLLTVSFYFLMHLRALEMGATAAPSVSNSVSF
ncbi:hypothetical protein HZA43_05815 [Candidatus Peregrinibacteria bacterium]|nr:hypothetical protein [Candidatus Peregrinibacteria bacterium]